MPKLIYETLPYGYLIAGAGLMLSQQGMLFGLAGVSLYCAGAMCWITRACYRQRHGRCYPTQEYKDTPKPSMYPIDNYKNSLRLSKTFYEILPFCYILAGLASYRLYLMQPPIHLQQPPSYLSLIATLLFCSGGFSVWILRSHYRGYHQHHSPVIND
ncbi:MAG: hypothetical protein V7707_03970 [Motiliproteus sp.]